MVATENLYAPPKASLETRVLDGDATDVWRLHKKVVLRRGCALPPRCVKCNAPVLRPLAPKTLYWHHPAVYLLILLNPLIYAVVGLIVRKKEAVVVGLCEHHRIRRRNGRWACVLGAALLIATVWVAGPDPDYLDPGALSVVIAALTVIADHIMARTLVASRIDDDFIHLKGTKPAFRETLPVFSD